MHELVTFFSYTFKECDVELIIRPISQNFYLTHLQSTCFAKSFKIERKATAGEFVFFAAGFRVGTVLKRDFAVNLAKILSVLGDFQS